MIKFLISLSLFFLLCFSCKQKENNPALITGNSSSKLENNSYYDSISNLDWQSIAHQFILKSSLSINYSVFETNKIYSFFDKATKDFLIVKVSYKEDINDMPLKWVKVDFLNNKVYDI